VVAVIVTRKRQKPSGNLHITSVAACALHVDYCRRSISGDYTVAAVGPGTRSADEPAAWSPCGGAPVDRYVRPGANESILYPFSRCVAAPTGNETRRTK
jgi:hypothetical protein